MVNLQPACNAFSSELKLPPYFKQYSKGFHLALKSSNLHIPVVTPTDFRIWKNLDLVNVTKPETENLKIFETCPTHPH